MYSRKALIEQAKNFLAPTKHLFPDAEPLSDEELLDTGIAMKAYWMVRYTDDFLDHPGMFPPIVRETEEKIRNNLTD